MPSPGMSHPRTTRALPVLVSVLAGALSTGCLNVPGPEVEDDRNPFVDLLGTGRPVYDTSTEEGARLAELETPEGDDYADTQLADYLAQQEASADGAAAADSPNGGEDGAAPIAAQPPPPLQDPPLNPYVEFGRRIVVHDNGMIVKPFPLPPGKANKILTLMTSYATFPVDVVAAGSTDVVATPDRVLAEVLADWDSEHFVNLRADQNAAAKEIPLADYLVITATPDLMYEVEDFIDTFIADVPQVEIEAKIVEVVETSQVELGVKGDFLFPDGVLVDSIGYDFPTTVEGATATLGAVQDEVTYDMLIRAAATTEDVEISSMPKIAVRENGRAEILNTQELPSYAISGIKEGGGGYSATLNYKEVGVKLYVIPRVVGTDTVALAIDIEASQQIGEQIFFADSEGSSLSAPVIANRSAKTLVYLRPGEGVILGGLTTERLVEQVTKVPFLGDLPLLGLLFRSKLDRTERTSVLFFIRPRILQGIDLQREF